MVNASESYPRQQLPAALLEPTPKDVLESWSRPGPLLLVCPTEEVPECLESY